MHVEVDLHHGYVIQGCVLTQQVCSWAHNLRQYVIVMRGRFATQEFLALDLDIMVRLDANIKRVS